LFAVIWVATVLGNTGTFMRDVASAWLVTDLSASPAAVAMIQTADTLPIFLFAIPAGVLSDILDRRRFLITIQIALAAVSAILLAVVASYVGGFLGILIAGLIITFAAVRYDLEKDDVGGGSPSPSLYARQVAARKQMSQDERNAYQAGIHALWRPLFVGRTIGIALIVFGVGGYLFL